ncbi:hypothetical protein ACHAWT_008441 [Skeletonema menzelii]
MTPLLSTATGILLALTTIIVHPEAVNGFSRSPHRATHHVHTTTLMSWSDDEYDGSYRSSPSRGGSSTRQKSGRGHRSNGGQSGRGLRGGGRSGSGRGSGQPRPNRESKESIRYPQNNFGYDDDDEYNYPNNNNDRMIQQQRMTNSIGCPLFGTCPGCVVDNYVADIDIIKSAQLYFSSSSVQKHISSSSHVRQSRGHYYNEDGDDDDEFYKIKVPSSITHWRTQAKLAVAADKKWSRDAGCKIGLYQRNSHDVLPIPDCQVHHPSINKAVEAVVKATSVVRTPAYQEDTGTGLLRYIQCQVELSTGKVCLTLVMNCEKLKECQPHLSYLVKELKRSEPKLWHSIWCHCNDSAGNAIFARDSTRWHPIEGPPYIREKLPGADPDSREGLLYFSPMVFRQANYEGFGEIAKQVREAIPNGSKVCELYAGVGLLGLSALLHHGKLAEEYNDSDGGIQWLRCSDENPENARCFERAVSSMPMKITGRSPKHLQKDKGQKDKRTRKNQKGKPSKEMSIKDLMDSMMTEASDESNPPPVDPSEKVTYMQASAAAAILKGQALGANVLIVDPPRKGLDEPVLQQLCQPYNPNQMYAEKPNALSHMPRHTVNWVNDVRTLIYVSCGFDALARDCDQLLSSNAGWKLESATGYVLFPGSNHVETVVVLRRK